MWNSALMAAYYIGAAFKSSKNILQVIVLLFVKQFKSIQILINKISWYTKYFNFDYRFHYLRFGDSRTG